MPTMEKNIIKLGFAENFMLSGTAAIVSKTMAAPLERVKLLLQNQDELIRFGRLAEPYKGITDCIKRTFICEGVRSFWRSNMVNCARYFPSQALNFAFNDQIKSLVRRSPTETQIQRFFTNVACGGLAGVLSSCFVYSLDYARTRLANDAKIAGVDGKAGGRQFSGLIDVYRQTLATDGIRGLHRGFFISVVALMVYRGFYFGLYDSLKPVVLGESPRVVEAFLLGYVITVCSNLMAYPLDTVRRRMMMTSGEKVHYKGSIDCALQIIRNEGPMSMMKGAGANILRNVAGAGVLVGFDKSKEFYIRWRLSRI
ncbi:ADP,ATP carrier protein [Plakobranchus ocellatus]|uniref:ADP/ATP translocase n=1 Tax=Plakobranchus ocellatus TaxID=259542 RepID=A0AAV4BH83_9GAST|nr:ADP,ATP carrier protein [Plakobranchus ocellatus]